MSTPDASIDANASPPRLPPGVKKEVLREAPENSCRIACAGEEVSVHYVGTLESDGTEFDSSRHRCSPYIFTLGRREVIKGWDFGISTMRKGEIAKFTIEPAFAYGPQGLPPNVPPNATLIFEIELLGWTSEEDIFGDGGVFKTQLKPGRGSRSPKDGDEILISMKAVADGKIIDERVKLEYVVGSDALGPIAKLCDMMLCEMSVDEEISVELSQNYAYGDRTPLGATLSLALLEIYQTKDVSPLKDGSIVKKQVREGVEGTMPAEGDEVSLFVESATDGNAALPGFKAQALKFTVGNGDVCDAIEWAVVDMKKYETAILIVTDTGAAAEQKIGLGELVAPKTVFTMKLQNLTKGPDIYDMNQEEALEWGFGRKDVGAKLFKNQRFRMALHIYTKLADLFGTLDRFSGPNESRAKELRKLCNRNRAACFLKLSSYKEAIASCDAVLMDDRKDIKAIYRRAEAHLALSDIPASMSDCKRVLELEPRSKDARDLLKRAMSQQKELDRQSQAMFTTMCKALGKGPIPEPFKQPCEEEEEVPDDDMDSFFESRE